MARFMDLDEDDGDATPLEGGHLRNEFVGKSIDGGNGNALEHPSATPPIPPVENATTSAFQCYP